MFTIFGHSGYLMACSQPFPAAYCKTGGMPHFQYHADLTDALNSAAL